MARRHRSPQRTPRIRPPAQLDGRETTNSGVKANTPVGGRGWEVVISFSHNTFRLLSSLQVTSSTARTSDIEKKESDLQESGLALFAYLLYHLHLKVHLLWLCGGAGHPTDVMVSHSAAHHHHHHRYLLDTTLSTSG